MGILVHCTHLLRLHRRVIVDQSIMISKHVQNEYVDSDWQYKAWEDIQNRITDSTYPCHFANVAERGKAAHYCFVDSLDQPSDLKHLESALYSFTNIVRSSSRKKRHVLLVQSGGNRPMVRRREVCPDRSICRAWP